MFKLRVGPSQGKALRGDATKAQILETALGLFRSKGFDRTTMRDIAGAAGLATGAAYYYFPSKEAIVAAYYAEVQNEHELAVRECLDETSDLRERLGVVMHAKLEILRADRRLLGALFRFTGDPDHTLSVFGKGSAADREHSIALFRAAIGSEDLPDDLRPILPSLLWMMHLGIVLFFIYDDSPEQRRTQILADGALDLVTQFVRISSMPLLKSVLQPIRAKATAFLREAGLVPES